MEGLHQADYPFPSPEDLIDSIQPETESERLQREIDAALDEKVKKAGEGGLDNFFTAMFEEIQQIDIIKSMSGSYKVFDNRRKYVDGKEEYKISFDMTHFSISEKDIGHTIFTVSYGEEITITYSSNVEGYTQISENSITIPSPLDIRYALNTILVLVPELKA